jgi:NAD(P)-dependent dehydrogenase (short-subunit alcohol dehydrogenase family)
MMDEGLRVYAGSISVITGGASGIGRALGEELVKRGGEVILADLQIELAEEAALEIRSTGGKAKAEILDVVDYPTVEGLLRKIVERTGRLDYMFNNAGISIYGDASLHKIEDWELMIDVNLRGVINGVQAAYQVMLTQGFGHIVNTASLAGLVVGSGSTSYTTTKHAVVGLSKNLRAEAVSAGIRVSVLCPSFVKTPILEGGKYGKMLVELSPNQQGELWKDVRFKPMPASTYARKALNAIAKNEGIIIIPFWWRLLWWIDRLSPRLGILMAQKSHHYMQNLVKGIRLQE